MCRHGQPLVSHKNETWSLSLSVGDPPETFTVLVSTGSSDLLLPGSDCSTCQGHKLYNPQASVLSTQVNSDMFEIALDGGFGVDCLSFTDTVTIGELNAPQQTIGVATHTARGQLDASVFSLKLAPDDSELFLGGINDQLYAGEITYTPVTGERYWVVTVGSINVNQEPVASDRKAIIESESGRITLSPGEAEVFFSKIPGARPSSKGDGQYAYPCDSSPTVSLTFGDRSFYITPDVFNKGFESEGGSYCVAAVVGDKSSKGSITIGAPFLMNVYTVFDFDNKQVGFASLA
ncbi:hypothetical protein DFQ26_001628 [Actinomortierella ambigua]|nr:hypothetical protein DFQ26_001628 [Actinomortierella ambigua]